MSPEAMSNNGGAGELLASNAPELAGSLAPEWLYWSVLEVPSGVRVRPGPLPIGFRSAFEEDVPERVTGRDAGELSSDEAQLHIVCVPVGPGRLVACGGLIGELRSAAGSKLVLTPTELPEFLQSECDSGGSAAGVAASMNLLVGQLEPMVLKAARNRQTTLVLFSMLIIAAMVVIGWDRRMRNDRMLAALLHQQAQTAAIEFGQRMGSASRVSPQMLPAVLAMTERAADAAMRVETPRDSSGVLAQVLRQWPGLHSADGHEAQRWTCSVQSLSAAADSVTMTLVLQGDSSAFLRAVAAPTGFVIEEPRLTSIGPGREDRAAPSERAGAAAARTRIVLRMRRTAIQDVAAAGGGQSR